MRHIPEEELHAYLDQALSRSQCVEIERHLTRCPRCRMAREEIAVVRDRTTDLLARVGPPPFLSPPFEQIRQQSHLRHRRRRHVAGWLLAAGLALAVLVQARPDRPVRQVAAATVSAPSIPSSSPAPAAIESASRNPPSSAAKAPQPSRPRTLTRVEMPAATPSRAVAAPPSQALEDPGPPATGTLTAVTFESPSDALAPGFSTLGSVSEVEAQPVDLVPAPPGLWLTVGSEDGRMAAPADAARIPGLPVVRVRVQPGASGSEVVAIDQLLETGATVRTLSGPPERVHSAIAGDGEFRAPSGADRLTVTIHQGDRMVAVTGPSEALGAMFSTSSLRRRY